MTIANNNAQVILGGYSKQSIATRDQKQLPGGGRQQPKVVMDQTIPYLSLTYSYKNTSGNIITNNVSQNPKSSVVIFPFRVAKGTLTYVKLGFGKFKGTVNISDVGLYQTVDVATPTPTPGPSSTPGPTATPTPIVNAPIDMMLQDWNVAGSTFTGWNAGNGEFSVHSNGNSTLTTITNPAYITNSTHVKLPAGTKKLRLTLTTGSFDGIKLAINNHTIGNFDANGFVALPNDAMTADTTKIEFDKTAGTNIVISDIAYIQSLFQGQVTKSCRVDMNNGVYTCTVNNDEKYTLAALPGIHWTARFWGKVKPSPEFFPG